MFNVIIQAILGLYHMEDEVSSQTETAPSQATY